MAGLLDVTVTEQVKVPSLDPELDETWQVPLGVTDAPDDMEKLIVAPGVKPVPLTVTTVPLGPDRGTMNMEGTVTVKEPVAVAPPVSVAVTVEPLAPEGTEKAQLNVPVPLIDMDPGEQEEMVTVSKTSDFSDDPMVNPVPETVTVDPSGPWLGVSVIVGVVIVKPAEATSDDTVEWSDPVAVIV